MDGYNEWLIGPFEFYRYVEMGVYSVNWGHSGDFTIDANE